MNQGRCLTRPTTGPEKNSPTSKVKINDVCWCTILVGWHCAFGMGKGCKRQQCMEAPRRELHHMPRIKMKEPRVEKNLRRECNWQARRMLIDGMCSFYLHRNKRKVGFPLDDRNQLKHGVIQNEIFSCFCSPSQHVLATGRVEGSNSFSRRYPWYNRAWRPI